MNNWNQKHLSELQRSGKIRGFVIPEKEKNYSRNDRKNIPDPKPKAILWLDMNLQLWCNGKALTLEMEYRFDRQRKFRFDYAISSGALKIAVEFEGGIYMKNSGHNTPKHYTKDTDKYNLATVLGWRIIRVTALNYTTVLKTLNEMVK